MEGSDPEPTAKRQRRSHHKNQLSAYCHCARCDGKVKQKPRTIDDHRTRYPRIDADPRSHAPVEDPLLENDNVFAGRRNPPPPSGDHLPLQTTSQPPSIELTGAAGSLTPGLSQAPCAPYDCKELVPRDRLGRIHKGSITPPEGEPIFAAEESDREYAFDQLLDEPHNHQRTPARILGGDFEHGIEDVGDDEAGNELYDADFGLPNGEPAVFALPQPQFQLPVDENDLESDREDDPDPEYDPAALCAAFQEPDLIRNAYIDAFVQKTLYRATQRASTHQLKAARQTLATHPDVPADAIAKMAQSIRTVERRLGVNTDSIITTYTLCPLCKRRYSPEYIKGSESERCLNTGCDGILFTLRKLASGGHRRVPNLTYPYASPISWLRHMLCLPGMSELMQVWQTGDDDHVDLTAPISCDEWLRAVDPDAPIGDITKGWGWRSTMAGLRRCWDPDLGVVTDESELDPPVRFVSLPFGISFLLNTDWFQATKEGNYSVGACYLVINNLPRHLRFLRENISLTIAMPGPNEPDHYALDQMLDPLIDDLLRLKQDMVVRRDSPPVYEEAIVHGELGQHIADLIAWIKLGGGAGVKSEMNFCLYCHTRLSSISVQAGLIREDFQFRDTQTDLDNAYSWKARETAEERKALFDVTGNRFTALHRLPSWHTSTSSPLDAMHLLYLGAMNWIVKQVLVGPGMLLKRQPNSPDPQDIFNGCLDRMWMPRNFQCLPPKLGQTRVSIKADQWKLAARIIYIPLYLALRDGDTIRPSFVPRGNKSSPAAKHQSHRAKLLRQQCLKHYESIGAPDDCPLLEGCFPSRNTQFHYRQVLRFCLATSILDKHTVAPADIEFAQGLLVSLCTYYVNHNVPLSPNFHYMTHLQESMLKTASVYNTHVWGMERANGIVSRINHNGRSGGILEGTLMRGWWSHMTIQNLIRNLEALPNPTPADQSVVQDLLVSLRGGSEDAQQRGTLMAYIAQCRTDYTRLHGIQNSTKLSSQSRIINLEKHGLYDQVLEFCVRRWPNAGIFGLGRVEQRYLAPVGMVRNHSYIEVNGVRYGAFEHTSGKGYCYGYIDGRYPVRIERILHIEFTGEDPLCATCAFVRPFRAPEVESSFPWDTWSTHLGAVSWAYETFEEVIVIPTKRFSGTFALFEVPTSQGRYWVTVPLDSVRPEQGNEDE